MKASVQYNDYRGTVAADDSDIHNLADFLSELGVDTDRYHPIGAKFSPHYESGLIVRLFCVVREKTTDENKKPHIVEIELEGPVEYSDFFGLFKRFTAIVIEGHYEPFEAADFVEVAQLRE